MKIFKLNTKKGFTLIELLVVISIISLLSSVVLASVRDSRDRAKSTAFRQEINQFINALELYRADNGKYPGYPATDDYFEYNYSVNDGVITESNAELVPELKVQLDKYIKQFPKPTKSTSLFAYTYDSQLKCIGDEGIPEYIIFVSSVEPGFDDWSIGYENVGNGLQGTEYRCFSLK